MAGPPVADSPDQTGARVAALFRLANQGLESGDLGQAERACAQVLELNPGNPHAFHLQGLIALRTGDLDLAIERVRRACRARDVPASYFSNLAEMLRRKGWARQAETAARKALTIDKSLPGAWNNLGIILQETGRAEESVGCFQNVLQSHPDDAQAHNNLGTAFKSLGLENRAELHWKQAVAIAPNYSAPASNLANLYTEWGRLEEAVAHGRRAVGGLGAPVDAYINLAAAELARQNFSGALGVIDRALERAPNDARLLSSRAMVLRQADQPDEAMPAIERAIALAPENAEIQFTYGAVLKARGLNDQALAAFEAAIALGGPPKERAMINRAALLGEIGRNQEALLSLNKVIGEFPTSANAHFYRSDYVKYEPADPFIPIMQSLLSKGPLSQSDTISLNFALGKAFLDIGDSDAAFRYLNEGNRLKRSTVTHDAGATSRWMVDIANAVSGDMLQAARGKGCPSDLPVFVLGMPRSGTTLVEQILGAHADIWGAGELRYVEHLINRCGGLPTVLSSISTPSLRAMGADYVARLGKLGQGRRRIVDKMPSNFLYAGLIWMMLPNAKIIHVRRDPIDTCLSCYSKLFAGEQAFAYDLAELGKFYGDYRRLTDHWRAVIPETNLLEVRYEEIVDDLEPQARRMVDFVGLPWDPACLDFHRSDRAVRTASINQVRRPMYRTSMGAWRKHEANLAPLIAALGADSAAARDGDSA